VRYYDVAGQLQEKTLKGWVARIFQHEFDHLQVRSAFFQRGAF
jgi:peptide deformylase